MTLTLVFCCVFGMALRKEIAMVLTFDQYKRQVIKLAKARGKGYLVPGADRLYYLWEKELSPIEVVDGIEEDEVLRKVPTRIA